MGDFFPAGLTFHVYQDALIPRKNTERIKKENWHICLHRKFETFFRTTIL